MALKKDTVTYFSLRKEVESGKLHPIYVLYGEESYYIDQLSELIVDKALSEDEKDFNLSVFYGSDADVREVISTCKQYPAFAQHKVVVLREAQLVRGNGLDLFKLYAEKPLSSTILVVCNKDAKINAKGLVDIVKKQHTGVVFESNRVKNDKDLKDLITNYSASIGCYIDDKSSSMLADFIGKDLSRVFSEIDKLKLLVDADNSITPELIERNIGISKDFNNYELQDALGTRNVVKANRIIDYFEKNPKQNPFPPTISTLFGFFSTLLLYRASRDKSQQGLMAATGAKATWQLKKYDEASRFYSTQSCVNIIGYLRECDVRCKGMGSRQDSYALLRELVYKILHS